MVNSTPPAFSDDTSQRKAEEVERAHPEWFRQPTRREHSIAAGLFIGFGAFFGLLFIVQRGWWFRWVVLAFGVISIIHGIRHALDARHRDS